MTTLSRPDAILIKTRVARARAESLLEGLLEAKSASEQRLAESRRNDPLKQVTGRSSLDNAIDATRRMIETLDRNMAEFRREAARSDEFVLLPRVTCAGRAID